jgi:hypothetical protein
VPPPPHISICMNLFEQTLKEECIVQELFGSRARLDLFKEAFLAYERRHGTIRRAYGIPLTESMGSTIERILMEAMYDIKNRDQYVGNLMKLTKRQILQWPPPDEARAEQLAKQADIEAKKKKDRLQGIESGEPENPASDKTQQISNPNPVFSKNTPPEEIKEYQKGVEGEATAGVNANAITPEVASKTLEFFSDFPELKQKFTKADLELLNSLASNIFSKKPLRGITDPKVLAQMRADKAR